MAAIELTALPLTALAPPLALIADAEPYLCRVFQARLEKNHALEVVCAATSTTALLLARQRSLDVIVWDLRLQDTLAVLPTIRALCPRAALVMTTTEDRPIVDTRLKQLGVADLLTKPFSLDTLVERIRLARLLTPRPPLPARRDLLGVGQEITVSHPSGRVATRILWHGYDTFCVLGAPRVPELSDWQTGMVVAVTVAGENARFHFDSEVIRARPEQQGCWELALPDNLRREQSRRSLRLPMRLPLNLRSAYSVAVAVVAVLPAASGRAGQAAPAPESVTLPNESAHTRRDDSSATTGETLPPFVTQNTPLNSAFPTAGTGLGAETSPLSPASGLTVDLSRGGCAVVTASPLPEGQIAWELETGDGATIAGTGRILRGSPVPADPGGTLSAGLSWQSALRFDPLPEPDADRLQFLLESLAG